VYQCVFLRCCSFLCVLTRAWLLGNTWGSRMPCALSILRDSSHGSGSFRQRTQVSNINQRQSPLLSAISQIAIKMISLQQIETRRQLLGAPFAKEFHDVGSHS